MTPVETLHGCQYLSFKLPSALDCECAYAIFFFFTAPLPKDWQCFCKLKLIKTQFVSCFMYFGSSQFNPDPLGTHTSPPAPRH